LKPGSHGKHPSRANPQQQSRANNRIVAPCDSIAIDRDTCGAPYTAIE